MIQFNRCIEDYTIYQTGDLPERVHKIKCPSNMGEHMKKAMPVQMISIAVLVLLMNIKAFTCHAVVIHPAGIFIGILIGFLLLSIHELLHAIVYPKDAKVTVGKIKGKIMAVALASHPLSRNRFILMCLLPYVLGVVPLAIFMFMPSNTLMINGILFGCGGMGLISPYMDLYNVILVLRQTKKKAKIQFYKDGMYWFE